MAPWLYKEHGWIKRTSGAHNGEYQEDSGHAQWVQAGHPSDPWSGRATDQTAAHITVFIGIFSLATRKFLQDSTCESTQTVLLLSALCFITEQFVLEKKCSAAANVLLALKLTLCILFQVFLTSCHILNMWLEYTGCQHACSYAHVWQDITSTAQPILDLWGRHW